MKDNIPSTSSTVDISVRAGLQSKFLYFWRQTFEDLFQILKQAEGIEFSLSIYACEEMSSAYKEENGPIIVHKELRFNAEIIVTEILDDYWASYLCFLNGFTKQSQQILRNTLELITQLLYLEHLQETGSSETDAWTAGSRGIGQVSKKIKDIKGKLDSLQPSLASRFNKTYDLLCTSTHSRKDRMTTMSMPRSMWASDCPSFEPTEVLYTRGLFLSVLNLELPLLKAFFNTSLNNHWQSEVVTKIEAMLLLLDKYQRVIQQFDKGYLIHQEYIALSSDLQVMYSVKIDGTLHASNRKKISQAQSKELKKKFEARLFQDKI